MYIAIEGVIGVGKTTLARLLQNTFAVSYTHLRAHETVLDLVCRLLLEKKKKQIQYTFSLLLTTHKH